MQTALDSMEVMEAMLEGGMQSSLSDAAVGMLCARTAVTGAYFNVRINARDLKDRRYAEDVLSKAKIIYNEALKKEDMAVALVDSKM
jgi:glutamate formiminotransferase/formiminotetrahydrofolate cyclodeaminase